MIDVSKDTPSKRVLCPLYQEKTLLKGSTGFADLEKAVKASWTKSESSRIRLLTWNEETRDRGSNFELDDHNRDQGDRDRKMRVRTKRHHFSSVQMVHVLSLS